MRSREHAWSMTDRTRRGITLSWLVLFVLSIMLQYGSLASPNSALAVHDENLFELDGNALNDVAAGDDWEDVYDGSATADSTRFITDPVNDLNDETFTGGTTTKDFADVDEWLWSVGKAPIKNDITHAFAAAYHNADDHLIAYFGLTKFSADGNNYAGFWFFQNPVATTGDGSPPGSPFSGVHADGDLLVLASYTNGGTLAAFDVYEWVGTGGDVTGHPELNTVASGVPCTANPGDFACGATNGDLEDSPWPFQGDGPHDPPNEFPAGTFFEGGIDLTELGLDDGCFTSFLAETRSSQSIDAVLKDFALGSFDTCGSVTIVKDAIPNDAQNFTFGGGLGAFSLDDDADATLPNSITFDAVEPGTYLVNETNIPAGWDLTGLTCNDGTSDTPSTVNLGTGTATINVDPVEDVTCTFTNTKRGTIIVEKQTNPDTSGGAAGPFFTFTGTAAGTIEDNGQIIVSNLVPGTYTSTEGDPTPPFDLGAITCDDGASATASSGNIGARTATFKLDPGETVKCTFMNVQRGTITIIKNAIPDDAQDFHYNTTGGISAFDLDDDANGTLSNTQLFSNVVPGNYSVAEVGLPGWDLTGLGCNSTGAGTSTSVNGATASLTLGPAGSITCTYENTKRGTIIVDKITLPGGDPTSFSFGTTGAGYSGFSLTDAAAPNNQEVLPGSYTVSETVPDGWDLTSATCDNGEAPNSVDVGPGETITCTFTNTKRGTIIVEKQTSPDGASGEFDFTGDAAGTIGDGGTIVVPNLVPGTYTSTEANPVPDFDLATILCDDSNSSGDPESRTATFELDPGETVTCTFWNTQRGTITIIKDAIPDDPQDFAFSTEGSGLSGFSLDDDANAALSNSKTFTGVVEGSYSVTEPAVAGWDLTDLTCEGLGGSSGTPEGSTATIEMVPGGSVICVFENTKRGSITIVKDAVPNDAQDFSFSGALGAFALDDDANATLSNSNTTSNLVSGTYAVTEAATVGWDLTGLTCNDGDGGTTINGATATIDLDPGQNITCTFVNSKPSIQIVKTAGTAADGGEFVTEPGNVTYHYVVTNTGPIALSGITVRDDNGTPANLADDFNATCPKTTLAAGESMECTATVAVAANRTNIATTTGTSGGGTTVQDTDDAVVRVPGLVIDKSYVGNTGGTAVNGTGIAKVGDTLTYTLAYDLTNGPVTNGVITDTLPNGLAYVVDSASTTAPFTAVNYNAATRTLTWTATTVSTDGSVSYRVTVLDGSFNLPQPLVNTATIDSDQTVKDDDTENVLVQAVLAATATPVVTLPPTDTIDSGDQAPSNPGFGLMLALLVLAGFGLVMGYLTPTPGRTRREEVRRR